MWNTPSETTWGPITRTAAVPSVSVTATARVDRTVWEMGDGSTVTCTTPGTPYEDQYGDDPSPDCGHRYTKTSVRELGNAYTVTATNYWVFEWAGGGQSGQIPLELSDSVQIRVGEMQVLVTR